MGIWALPHTTEKAKRLQALFAKPIYFTKKVESELYDLYGDDELWDEIQDRKYEYGSRYDMRFLIASCLDGELKYYEEKPECFNVKFDRSAIKILKAIVKEQGL